MNFEDVLDQMEVDALNIEANASAAATVNVKDELLLSEDSDCDWPREAEGSSEIFEEKYFKILDELKSTNRKLHPNKKQRVLPVKRKLYKIKIDDLLFSKHYKSLRACVLENRIQKISDIEKMLKGEQVCEETCEKDSKTFYKRRKDDQLIRGLCRAEYFLTSKEYENASENAVGDKQMKSQKNDLEDIRDELEEELLSEW